MLNHRHRSTCLVVYTEETVITKYSSHIFCQNSWLKLLQFIVITMVSRTQHPVQVNLFCLDMHLKLCCNRRKLAVYYYFYLGKHEFAKVSDLVLRFVSCMCTVHIESCLKITISFWEHRIFFLSCFRF